MDAIPYIWETMDDECCTLRMENVAFGGSLASLKMRLHLFPLGHFPLEA
jgi:hypothetical protein